MGHTNVRVDLVDEEKEIAIEVKGSRWKSIKQGLFQCSIYESKGYRPLFVTPLYSEEVVEVFDKADIPLTLYDPNKDEFIPITFERGVSTVLE